MTSTRQGCSRCARSVVPLLGLLLLLVAPVLAQQSPTAYRILITNDDGVRAEGILALARALGSLGEITIVAPNENQTGKGHSISITDPIYAETVTLPGGLAAISLTATPASCVKVALAALMPQRPDLVVSGINRGYNLGMVTLVSGTVGAAREASLQGIPAIAASLAAEAHPDYTAAAQATAKIASLVKSRGLPRGVFLNLNVPPGTADRIKGIRVTRQSALTGTERFEEHNNPRGRRYFWNSYQDATTDEEGTDVWATSAGYVAVTPLHVSEFDRETFEQWKDLR